MHRHGFEFYMAELERRLEQDAILGRAHPEPRLLERSEQEERAPVGNAWLQTLLVAGLMGALGATLMALTWAA